MNFGTPTFQNGLQSLPSQAQQKRAVQFKRLQKLMAAQKFQVAHKTAMDILKSDPTNIAVQLINAQALLKLGRPKEATFQASAALQADPQNQDAILLTSTIFQTVGDLQAELALLRQAVQANASWPVRQRLGQRLIAEHQFLDALNVLSAPGPGGAMEPAQVELIGICLRQLGRITEARAAFELATRIDPQNEANFMHLAELTGAEKNGDPRPYLAEVLKIAPHHDDARARHMLASMIRCDWDSVDEWRPGKRDKKTFGLGKKPPTPWSLFAFEDDPVAHLKRQRAQTKSNLRQMGLSAPLKAPSPARAKGGRLRVGYFSSDFYLHATTQLVSGVLRHHDPARFEIHCFDYGQTDQFGQDSTQYCSHVHRMPQANSAKIAARAREVGLDIAVDIKGDTTGGRFDLFPRGLAPVQINYLAYPGTLANPAYDYIIADAVTIPPKLERHYDEAIIRLPTCYLPADDTRRTRIIPTRTALDLPQDAVVLACLSQHYKISRNMFDIWLRALDRVSGAVLWLLNDGEESTSRLRGHASKAGIAADRLIFGEKMVMQDHLDRIAQADLYLDTFPYNGHTLAADAICAAQVPILTRTGHHFAARVGAAFTTAAGLPELIAESDDAYYSKLVDLASDPADLRALRGKIAQNRTRLPLFSSRRYTRILEDAFATAHARAQAGAPAKSFDVPLTSADTELSS